MIMGGEAGGVTKVSVATKPRSSNKIGVMDS